MKVGQGPAALQQRAEMFAQAIVTGECQAEVYRKEGQKALNWADGTRCVWQGLDKVQIRNG